MDLKQEGAFDAPAFLASAGHGRKLLSFKAKKFIFSQGQPADCVYYLRSGRVKLSVVSTAGKEATITLLNSGDFLGEECIIGTPGLRLASAIALNPCAVLWIKCSEMIRILQTEHAFADIFIKFLLTRSMRTQADLVDQLFNNSEKRLARILLLMAEYGQPAKRRP